MSECEIQGNGCFPKGPSYLQCAGGKLHGSTPRGERINIKLWGVAGDSWENEGNERPAPGACEFRLNQSAPRRQEGKAVKACPLGGVLFLDALISTFEVHYERSLEQLDRAGH
jgi:hypothetical protein